jgi:hypothetical protein
MEGGFKEEEGLRGNCKSGSRLRTRSDKSISIVELGQLTNSTPSTNKSALWVQLEVYFVFLDFRYLHKKEVNFEQELCSLSAFDSP